ncbi:rhamnan synthesis F family protein [Nitrosovibrio sp. Nv4]|uniref:rhamnan synthesis F family protein n=1 Tax=Nitrosovibrio sp. Nv4 TaxID=1945880 RepID=UPI000BCEACC1|nr:rhamnan synthesis F family protein [Nitrosovibrio sp. Nv4]SOD41708.1 Rhamnan synthesis protein F [Nitrosovibrio sp. Nv4]
MKNFIKWPLKAIAKDLRYFRDLSFYLLTRENITEKPLVRLHKEGVSSNYDRPICLFCSYDKENIVKENVYYYLNELMLAGFDIVFISSSDTIVDADLKKLSKCCIKIINRENRGYDFYGWKTGLEKYPQYKFHVGLLLANDSVLGPLFNITDIIARLENCEADIIGMTNCFHFYPHLQSYFLYCKKTVVLSEEFLRFFQEVKVLELKVAVIRKYEVGFSRILSHRFRIAALYDLERVLTQISYREKPMKWIEPTFHLWKPLVTEFKFPFLKKSLLTRRGVSTEEVSKVLTENNSTYNLTS